MSLTETQKTVLTAAAGRASRSIEPLPPSLKGGAAQKVVTALLASGMAEEAPDANGIRISDDGLKAIGAAKPRARREDTKSAAMIALMRRPEGATIAQIETATGWQKHTIRGAISAVLKKKLGLTVTSNKVEGNGRVYRVHG